MKKGMSKVEQRAIRTVFMRGGTSKALFFHQADLPADRMARDSIFLAAMGSPDPGGRQLNGMGGGITSLSKIAVIGPASRPDADVDYTFGQVAVTSAQIGYGGNCGNISAAVGPFAVDEGLVAARGDRALVRIHNTNTSKIIHAEFGLVNGKARVSGAFVLAGVAGSGDPVGLSFLDPGGAATGKLLPTGRLRDRLDIAGLGTVEVTMLDVANPVVFVAAEDIGMTGAEMPAALDSEAVLLAQLEAIRVAAALAMGLVSSVEEARTTLTNLPLVSVIAPAQDTADLGGTMLPRAAMDILTRMFSSGQPHRASPATAAMCLAAAAKIKGTVVSQAMAPDWDVAGDLRLGHPSGILVVGATVTMDGDVPAVTSAKVYRTARRLMEGAVLVPAEAG